MPTLRSSATLFEQRHHLAGAFGVLVDPRRILRIDQHDVGADGLNARDAFLDEFCGLTRIEIAQHRVGADLPDHQIRMQVDDGGLQPLHHFGRVLAALAGIDDGDVGGRIFPAQLRGEPVGIVEVRRGGAVALRRRRSERHDHDRLARDELARDVRQRSHRFGAALRRQARHAAEDVAGRFGDFLHLVDRLAGDALLRGRIDGGRRGRRRGAFSRGLLFGLVADLALSDSAACWAVCCGAVWASSGDTAAGITSARLTAQTVGNVDKQKG